VDVRVGQENQKESEKSILGYTHDAGEHLISFSAYLSGGS